MIIKYKTAISSLGNSIFGQELLEHLMLSLVEELEAERRNLPKCVIFLSAAGTNREGNVFREAVLIPPYDEEEATKISEFCDLLNPQNITTIAVNVAVYPTLGSKEIFCDNILIDLGSEAMEQAEKCLAQRAHLQQSVLINAP